MLNSVILKVMNKYRHEMFYPSFYGVLFNPFYFARKGLVEHLKMLAPEVSGKVLDVGCGNKPYLQLYQASEYVGLEIDTPNNRRRMIADKYYDGNKFPFSDAEFDAVVSNQVFEHVANPDKFLSEVSRVLNDDGVVLLTAPFMWDEHEQPHDYFRYSSYGVREILSRHGFEVIELQKSMDDVRAVFQLLNAYIYKITCTEYKVMQLLATFLLIAPINVVGEVLSWITPRNADLYLDNIVLAKKSVRGV